MQSVYFHVLSADTRDLPSEFKPMPLQTAACIIKRDRLPRAEARRRLAIMKLAGGLRPMHDAEPGKVELGPPIICDALSALDAPVDQILVQLGERLQLLVQHRQVEVENMIRVLLQRLLGTLGTDCAEVVGRSTPDTEPGTKAISCTISVQRPLSDVKPVMDPQNWASCNSSYFAATYIAKQNPDGSPVIDPQTGDVSPAPDPPKPGTTWTRPLFEYFVFDTCGGVAGCPWQTWFKNVLGITAQDGEDPSSHQPQHRFDYSLKQSIRSAVLGVINTTGGITTDQGSVVATAGGSNSTLLVGTKFIKFDGPFNPVLNAWAAALLPEMCDEIAGESGGGVCCDLGQPSGG
jgi:hypothetical protein